MSPKKNYVLLVLLYLHMKIFLYIVNELIRTATPPAAKITGNGHMKSHGDTKKYSRIGKE